MVNGRNLEGRPMALVEAALKIDPKHQKSLALAGTAAFNRGDYAKAVAWWQQLKVQLPPDSEQARSVAASIAQAQAQGGAAANAAPAAAPAAAGASVEGTVTVSDALRARLAPGATLFVFARPSSGGGMPLAIQRVSAAQLPFRFKLDDALAMSPARRISGESAV